ncbi:MAG TPA: nitroreductase [Aequorivita sp.]|nr:nitroreductase [Aequorivita sp.]
MIKDIIKNRRAVFPVQYNEQSITKEEITTVLEAANWAPTHRRTEPWRFKVFHGESQKALGEFMAETYKATAEKFSERTYEKMKENPVKAGCIIAICMQRDPKEGVPEWEEIASTAMAVQNMWLTASEMKIGTYWSSPSVKKHLGKFVDLAEGERCLGFFYMGRYDDELPEGTRNTTIEEKTTWI